MKNEDVLCPGCGREMLIKRGIKYNGKYCRFYTCRVCNWDSPQRYGATVGEAEEAARAAALRRFTPPQKPLTYEQMKERAAENAPVYCIPGVGNGGWMTATCGEQSAEDGFSYPGGVDFDAEDIFGNVLDGDLYGLREPGGSPHCLGWIAFDRKPTDREIKAADWRKTMAKKHCCKTCKWYIHEDITDGMVCVNGSSDYCTEFTDEDFRCDEWEKKPDEERERS